MGEGGQDPGFFRKGFKLHKPKYVHVLRQSGCACLQQYVGEFQGTCLALGCSSFVSPRNPSPWQWIRNRHRGRQTSEEHLELISWLVWAQGCSEWPSTVWNPGLYTLGQMPSLSVISDLCFPLPCPPPPCLILASAQIPGDPEGNLTWPWRWSWAPWASVQGDGCHSVF